jgi:hypothetical protein
MAATGLPGLSRSCTSTAAAPQLTAVPGVTRRHEVPGVTRRPAIPSAGLSSWLVSLTELKLSGNLLADLSGLQGCSCLRVLDASRNNLTGLQVDCMTTHNMR